MADLCHVPALVLECWTHRQEEPTAYRPAGDGLPVFGIPDEAKLLRVLSPCYILPHDHPATAAEAVHYKRGCYRLSAGGWERFADAQ